MLDETTGDSEDNAAEEKKSCNFATAKTKTDVLAATTFNQVELEESDKEKTSEVNNSTLDYKETYKAAEAVSCDLFNRDELLSDIEDDTLEIDMDGQDSPSLASDATDICYPEWTVPRGAESKEKVVTILEERKSPISTLILKRNSLKSDFELRFKDIGETSPTAASVPPSAFQEEEEGEGDAALRHLSPRLGVRLDQVSADCSSRDKCTCDQFSLDKFLRETMDDGPSLGKDDNAPARRKKARNVENMEMVSESRCGSGSGSGSDLGNTNILNKELGPRYNWLELKIKNGSGNPPLKIHEKPIAINCKEEMKVESELPKILDNDIFLEIPIKKEKSTDCDSALIPLLCVHG